MLPVMNSSPSAVADLFTFAEVTLIQYSTIAGHLPGLVSANSAKHRRKQIHKVEAAPPEPPNVQAHAVSPPKSKGKGHPRGQTPDTGTAKPTEGNASQPSKGDGKGKKGKVRRISSVFLPFFRGICKTTAAMSIKWIQRAIPFRRAKNSCKDTMMLSKDQMRPKHRTKPKWPGSLRRH